VREDVVMSSHPRAPRGVSGYRQTLGSRPFRRLWFAALVSRAGDAINFVALALLAFTTTGSAVAVAGLVLVESLALVVGGLTAQLVVDRVEPRRLLVAADLGRAVAAATLAVMPTYPMALVVAVALGLGTSWFSPTSGALVPRLVAREMLRSATRLYGRRASHCSSSRHLSEGHCSSYLRGFRSVSTRSASRSPLLSWPASPGSRLPP
jgi:Na+/melibiose symporter-like transporter